MKRSPKIFIAAVLVLLLTTKLIHAFDSGKALTRKQAVNIAEKFLADNGYTFLPANKAKIMFELLDRYQPNIDSTIKEGTIRFTRKLFALQKIRIAGILAFFQQA